MYKRQRPELSITHLDNAGGARFQLTCCACVVRARLCGVEENLECGALSWCQAPRGWCDAERRVQRPLCPHLGVVKEWQCSMQAEILEEGRGGLLGVIHWCHLATRHINCPSSCFRCAYTVSVFACVCVCVSMTQRIKSSHKESGSKMQSQR